MGTRFIKYLTLDLATKPNEANVNGIVYDNESYLKAINQYINTYVNNGIAYIADSYSKMSSGQIDPFASVGRVIRIDLENSTADVEIFKSYDDSYVLGMYYLGVLNGNECTIDKIIGFVPIKKKEINFKER